MKRREFEGRNETGGSLFERQQEKQATCRSTRQRVRHYGLLSRRSKTDLDELRATILHTMVESEPELELVEWTVPVLKPSRSESAGPLCPTCGNVLTFDTFIRIRPPPLEWRGRN